MGEVISKAIKNSSKIKSQFYQYKSAEKHYKSSGLAGFLPDINLQYNFDSNFNLDTSEKTYIAPEINRWRWYLCHIQSIKPSSQSRKDAISAIKTRACT